MFRRSMVRPLTARISDVGNEPILESVYTAAANWIPQVAIAFTGGCHQPAAVRTLADNTRDSAGADWGLVLFVVDSSNDL